MSLLAIVIGLIITLFVGLFNQLIYILVAAAISRADTGDGFFSTHEEQLWFISALLVYCFTMLVGGAVTALIARNRRPVLSGAVMGCLAGLLMLATMIGVGKFTWMSAVLLILALLFSGLGAKIYTSIFANTRAQNNQS
jgi:hypothetical protein